MGESLSADQIYLAVWDWEKDDHQTANSFTFHHIRREGPRTSEDFGENAALKAKVKSQESELTILTEEKKNLEEKLSAKCSELKKSVSENERLREELEKLSKERDTLKKLSRGRKNPRNERKKENEISRSLMLLRLTHLRKTERMDVD
ncbi:hypothetical protein M9Y10_007648 [Tritrichomonas musculus]|uniref:Uncharacterized protein n=1 Tax=Tritrichomonas musculus TaxID=1915356 RepID=A0ABR2J1Y1_9EUKA